ncbi:MAG: thioredoxin [Candidatus Daviesbacteria bacterium]|nr:thioredoxin [Candidatus Daviesbacteria bacterium]
MKNIKFLDFWASWCSPCQAMKPVISEIEKELKGQVEVIQINVDENQAEASKYGVMGIPTFIVLKDGKEVGRKTGVTPKIDLLKMISA